MSLLRLPRAAPALRRSYATAANVSEAAGVKVLGIDNGLRPATSSVSVIVKAGSRYEPAPGVAHVLKNFVFKVRVACRPAPRQPRSGGRSAGIAPRAYWSDGAELGCRLARGQADTQRRAHAASALARPGGMRAAARVHALAAVERPRPPNRRSALTSQSTASGSALKTVRETELYGGVLSAGLSREYLYINAEFLRGDE
jgi:predicted Zn-dependent peptidase